MANTSIERRKFLQGLGMAGLGGGLFTLGAPKGSWAAGALPTSYHAKMSVMGTLLNITIFGEKQARAAESCRLAFEEFRRIEDLMSTHKRYSALSEANARAGSEMIETDPRIIEVLWAAKAWGDQTGGVFDVTTLPLLKAWGFRESDAQGRDAVEAARECVGYRQIAIEGHRFGLSCKGAGVDVGGIAKGYAVDRAVSILRDKCGVTKAIVEAGGDLYCLGRPEDAAGWTIGVRNPVTNDGPCATFELCDRAAATSGNYGEKPTESPLTRSDKFNPFTGEPESRPLSTTALAASCADADAASTTFFITNASPGAGLAAKGIATLQIRRKDGGMEFDPSEGFGKIERV